MKEYEISSPQEGMSLVNFLNRTLPGAGINLLYKQLRKKNINLNGKKASGREKLLAGDLVQVYFSDETLEKFEGGQLTCGESRREAVSDTGKVADRSEKDGARGKATGQRYKSSSLGNVLLRVLYEDDDIIAVDKPAGVLSQTGSAGSISLNEMLIGYLLEKGEVTVESLRTVRPSVCNRLDMNTSGIVLCGKTIRGLKSLGEQIKQRSVIKKYLCIVKGEGRGLTDGMKAYITKDRGKNLSRVDERHIGDDSLDIETGFTVLESRKSAAGTVSLVEARLYTGRSHQIRAHLSYLGFPIAGDVKYGALEFNRILRDKYKVKRQLLHASYIRLENGFEIRSGLPEDFLWLHGLPEV